MNEINNDIAEQTKKSFDVDFSLIPSNDEFQKAKVKPPARWYNTLMSLILATTGICLGVIIAIVIVHYT
jgi:capsular polysaccharide biosynthesis protein